MAFPDLRPFNPAAAGMQRPLLFPAVPSQAEPGTPVDHRQTAQGILRDGFPTGTVRRNSAPDTSAHPALPLLGAQLSGNEPTPPPHDPSPTAAGPTDEPGAVVRQPIGKPVGSAFVTSTDDAAILLNRQAHTTNLVLDTVPSTGVLNVDDENHGKAGFKKALEAAVNAGELAPYNNGSPFSNYLTQVVRQGNPQPILVKIINPNEQGNVDKMEANHTTYVNLLGSEFVEDSTRITVTNPAILQRVAQQNRLSEVPQSLEGFAQDMRGINERQELGRYLVDHYDDMDPAVNEQIRTFLSRVLQATRAGYGLDIGTLSFDTDPTLDAFRLKFANIFIDAEGISLIDTGYLTTDNNSFREMCFNDARIATLLLTHQITPDQAFEMNTWEAIQREQPKINAAYINEEIDRILPLLAPGAGSHRPPVEELAATLPHLDVKLVKHAIDRPTIEREIVDGIGEEGSVFGFLNNFETRLPGGMNWQEATADPSWLERPNTPRMTPDEYDRAYYSDRYLKENRGQVLDSVREAISSEGLDEVRLHDLRQTYIEAQRTENPDWLQLREEYLKYALPVYVHMRMMGYSHHDLWG